MPTRRSFGRACAGTSGSPAYTGSSCDCFCMKRFTMRVLERVETDHAQVGRRARAPAARRSSAASISSNSCVDLNADRLKRASRRMFAGLARRHGAGDDLGELQRACRSAARDALPRSRALCASRSAPRRSRESRAQSRAPARRPTKSAAVMPAALSIRMSSGPSCAKLKPRAALSSCGEDTPRSSNTPSNPPTRSALAANSLRRENGPCTNVSRSSAANRSRPARIACRIPIDRNHPALLAHSLQNRSGVAASAERRIEVAPALAYLERDQHFIEKHRRVLLHRPRLQRQRFKFRRQFFGGLSTFSHARGSRSTAPHPRARSDCPDR